jgi:non-specific serine/threonine protein kinase
MKPMIGKTVAHYRILAKLGEGGMGVVYKAEDMKLKRHVALKFLSPELTRDAEAKERFIREARAASSLDHPNICTIHGINETEEGRMYIVMGSYEGKTLADRLSKGPLAVEDAVDYTVQIARGLARAHEEGITHRDIKPANIIVTDRGEVKILDFGLARLTGQAQLTRDTSTLGTVAYMSPEQVRGESVDQRTDIWSLGVLLYEMITGELPFKGKYEQAIIYSILHDEPGVLSEIRADVPDILDPLIRKTIAKDPADRYQDIHDLLKELESRAAPASTPAVPRSGKPKRSIVAVQAYAIFAGVLIFILCLFGLYKILFTDGKSGPPEKAERKSIAVLPFASFASLEEDDSFSDGIHDDILTQLAKIGDLKVIARTSVLQYKDTQKRIIEIGEELGVNAILEGSVRKAAGRVRITAQLIDARTEEHLWAESYDREFADIFAIQSDVAEKIAAALQAELTTLEKSSINRHPTDNMEAYNYYLKANYFFNNYYSKDKYTEAVDYYEKAVELDPDFVLAYVKMVKVNTLLYVFKTWDHTDARLEKCRSALRRAIELAPDLPEVHEARGHYLEWIEKDYEEALNEYEIALENSPNNSIVFSSMGRLFLCQGQAEMATEYFMKSYELNPRSGGQSHLVSWSCMVRRDWVEAEKWIDIYISESPERALGYYRKIEICIYGYGDLDRAQTVFDEGNMRVKNFDRTYYPWMIALYSRDYQEAFRILEADSTKPHIYSMLKGQVQDYMNDREGAVAHYESARSILEKKIDESPENAFLYSWLGLVHAGLGNKAEALRYSEQAVELHPIRTDPWSSGEDILMEKSQIHIITGEHEQGLDHLETLLTIPSQLTRFRLKLDPIYDPVRGHPRFKELVNSR